MTHPPSQHPTNATNAPCPPPYRPSASFSCTGTATMTWEPTGIVITVTVRGQGRDRRQAYDSFLGRLRSLEAGLVGIAEFVAGPPSESERPEADSKRGAERFAVTTMVKASIAVDCVGGLLKVLVEHGLPFSAPEFTFADTSESIPELFGAAAANSRAKAAAIAAGGGFTLGAVMAADCGDKKLRAPEIVFPPSDGNSRRREWWQNAIGTPLFSQTVATRLIDRLWRHDGEPEDLPEIDHSIMQMLNSDVPARRQTASVTIEYEILPIAVAA